MRGRTDEREQLRALIAEILATCPRRCATSADERQAQGLVGAALAALGCRISEHPFRFNESTYENVALHFGLSSIASLASLLAPPVGALVHGLVAGSYYLDSTKRGYVLRRILPFRDSQNLVATLPADGRPALRLVFLAHADAAFTGLAFSPALIRTFAGTPRPRLGLHHRPLAIATACEAALAGLDTLRSLLGPLGLPLVPLGLLLAVPGLLSFLLSVQVALRNEVVPGANDNLTGVAALPVLAARLAASKRPDVELVFVATGCEEAHLGGSAALARDMASVWDKERTVVLALDTLCGGDLFFAEYEAEAKAHRVPSWLAALVREVAASEPRFAEVDGFQIPAGGSDAGPFLFRGWDAVALTCVDRTIGAPRHYHQPTDTLENLDLDQVLFGIDFAEKLTHAIVAHRLPVP